MTGATPAAPGRARRAGGAGRWVLPVVVLALLAFGLVYSRHVGSRTMYDEADYLQIARHLATEHAYRFQGRITTLIPPGYSYSLTPLAAMGVPVWAMRWTNFLYLALSVLLLYGLVTRLSGSRGAGRLAAVLAAGYPLAVYCAGTLYPQSLGTLLLLLALALACRPDPIRVRTALAAGLTWGAAILTFPLLAFSMPALAAFQLAWWKRRGWVPVLVTLCAAALVVGAWTARNYKVTGRLVPISSNGGWNFLLGNFEQAHYDMARSYDIRAYTRQTGGMDEVERDHFFTRSALNWIASHRREALVLYGRKVLYYFSPTNTLETPGQMSRTRAAVLWITYVPLLAVLVAGLVRGSRWLGPQGLALGWIYVANAPWMAVTYPRIRHRIPLDVVLIGVVALVAWRWLESVRRRAPAPSPRAVVSRQRLA